MSSTVFPGQHTTTTTITESATQVNPTIRFDREYLNKLSGQLKVVEIVLSVIALIFVSFSYLVHYDRVAFFETVAVSAIWWNTIILLFYLFHVIERFYKIPWLKVEVVSSALFAALYFLAALLSMAWLFSYSLFTFMLLASVLLMAVFGYDAYLKLQALQAGEIAQGVRVVSQVTEVNQPPYRY